MCFRYYAYLFDSQAFREQIQTEVYGVKVFHPTQQIIKNAFTVIPPITEQHAIAAFLDDRCGQVDGIIADLERQMELLRTYKISVIYEAVTNSIWTKKRVKYLASIFSGATPSKEVSEFWDGDIPWISSYKSICFWG
jgi:restriction endonuclease S subunit